MTHIYKSTDGGENWISVNEGLKDLNVHALLAVGDHLYALNLKTTGTGPTVER